MIKFKLGVARKSIAVLANLSLLLNSFIPFLLFTTPAYAQEATPTETPAVVETTPRVTPEITQTPEITPTIIIEPTAPVLDVSITPTSEITITPESTTISDTNSSEIRDLTSEISTTPTPSSWTFEKVELNKEYISPQNSQVKLTFTKLPTNAGNIKIEEITLTPEQIKQTGSLSDKAYDITSDMTDGDFTYNLSLPVPESAKGQSVEVKFSEDISKIDSAQKVENTITNTDTSVSVGSLDHFTIFVVAKTVEPTTVLVSNLLPDWSTGVYSAYYGWTSDTGNTTIAVSPGLTSIYDGKEAGIIKAGQGTLQGDEGLFGFKPTVTINSFATIPLTYDVENETGINPVWMTIEVGNENTRNTNPSYQFVPTSNPSGWHTVDAGAGQWYLMDNYGNSTGSPMSLSQIATANTGLNVVRVYLRLGMGSSYLNNGTGTKAWVDKATLGGITYDFVINGTCIGASITPPSETTACYTTIQAAINAASGGDTIKVATGTYTEIGQIVINKNLSIVGMDMATTIIKPAQNTGNPDAGDLRAWFLVNPGVTFNLSNVTLDGSGKLVAIGILSRGNGTIENNIIKNIGYNPSTDYYGRGIQLYDTNMTVQNNTLQNIGRIGIFGYGSGVTSAIIKGNNYTGKGNGNWLDYGVELGGGAVATISNNIISGNRGVASDGSTSAGILVSTFFASGTTATITGNTISNSTDGIAVGYDASDISTVVAHNNKLEGNTNGINSTHPVVSAINNWWGDQSGPYDIVSTDGSTPSSNNGSGSKAVGAINYDPWCITSDCSIYSNADLVVPTNLTPADGTYTNNSSFNNTWFAVNGAVGYEYQTSYSANGSTLGSIIYSDSSAAKPDRYNLTDNIIIRTNITAPDANYYWQVRAINAQGTAGPWSQIYKVTVDTAAPNFTITIPTTNQIIMGRLITINGTATDTNFNYYYCYVSNVNGHEYGARDAACTTTWHAVTPASVLGSVTLPNDLADGNYVVHLIGYDKAMNSAETTQSFVLDNTAPPTPTHSSPADNSYLTTANWTLADWSTETDTNGPVTYIYESSTINTTGLDESFISPAYVSGTLTNSQIPTLGTPQGIYYWHVRSQDALGNASAWSMPWKITVDNTAPVAPTASPIASDYNSDQSVTLVSSDSGSGLKNIYYTLDGTTPDKSKALYAGAITVNKDMTIKAIAYDNADNASGVLTATYGIAPKISSENSSLVTSTTATVTWTTDDISTSRVVYDTVSHVLGTALNYGYASSTVEDSTKVISHLVGLTGLFPETTYYYRTISHGSPEAVSDEKTFTTTSTTTTKNDGGGGTVAGASTSDSNSNSNQCNNSVPDSPTNLLATSNGDGSVTLTWNHSPSTHDGYLIAFGPSSGNYKYGAPNVGNVNNYKVQGLTLGAQYCFYVRSLNGCMPGGRTPEYCINAGSNIAATNTTPPGFQQNVLGATTEITPTLTPTSALEKGNILGISDKEKSDWWKLLFLLFLIPLYIGGRKFFKKK